jgi:DNA-binding NarL/FixJ family response regulator
MSHTSQTQILLVDDHRIVRQGLKALLEAEADFKVVAEADNGRQAVDAMGRWPVDVVITDVGMPDMNGIEATRRALAIKPEVKVVGLSMHADSRFVTEMLRAGASGYVLKDSAFEDLVRAVRSALAGKTYLSPGIPQQGLEGLAGQSPNGRSAFATLTPREREVLQLVAEGLAMKQIAAHLKVSIKTIETHRRQLMDKLGIFSVAELTKYAIREGLTTVDAAVH